MEVADACEQKVKASLIYHHQPGFNCVDVQHSLKGSLMSQAADLWPLPCFFFCLFFFLGLCRDKLPVKSRCNHKTGPSTRSPWCWPSSAWACRTTAPSRWPRRSKSSPRREENLSGWWKGMSGAALRGGGMPSLSFVRIFQTSSHFGGAVLGGCRPTFCLLGWHFVTKVHACNRLQPCFELLKIWGKWCQKWEQWCL